jgi:ribosomal-protein-alanine N-acetyltransferase
MSEQQGYAKSTEEPLFLSAFSWPRLETESLMLRPLNLNDAEDMFEYARDPRVSQYLSWKPHATSADSAEFLRGVLTRYMQGAPAPWGIEHREDRKLIGTCGFLSCNFTHHYADIGYLLAPT